MVDDEVDRHQRIDLSRIGAEMRRRVAHGGEVDDRRHAGEILHQHARRPVGDLAVGAALFEPGRDGADVVGGDASPVLEAEQVLEQHLEREGEAGDTGEAVPLRVGQREIGVGLAADLERPPAFEGIERGLGQGRAPLSNASMPHQQAAGQFRTRHFESAGEEERLSRRALRI